MNKINYKDNRVDSLAHGLEFFHGTEEDLYFDYRPGIILELPGSYDDSRYDVDLEDQ